MSVNNKKLHWFCFSFIGQLAESSDQAQACTYVGYSTRNISMSMINTQKDQSGLTNKAVLVSVTYLGKMTKAEFTGEKP